MSRLIGLETRRASAVAALLIAPLIGGLTSGGSVAVAAASASAAASAAPTRAAIPGVRLSGGDISWPNCPKGMGIPSRRSEGQPMPIASAAFTVVGLTNGPGFTPNPCLASHVAWAGTRGVWTSAYAMTTFPTAVQRSTYGATGPWAATTSTGQLRNAGYAQALFNVAAMSSTGLDVPFVWIDVEPYAVAPWSHNLIDNRQVVRGAVQGYEDSGYRVGFYSYLGGWRAVVGAWHLPTYPTWVPVGHSTNGLAVASARCATPSFSGGEVLLAQWVEANRDRDVTCPRLVGRVAGWTPLTQWIGLRLHRGSRGAAVSALQRGIGAHVDGRFGRLTRIRLVRFQRSRGLVANGISGRSTWRALGAGRWLSARPSRLAEVFSLR